MIGNDIIDLALTSKESNWQRKGILDKLFTISEQEAILNAENSELMYWNLWSRKEAAYKIYNRLTKIRAFIPKQLECSALTLIDVEWIGKVVVKEHLYYTKTLIAPEYIYTTAVSAIEDFKKIQTINSEDVSKNSDGIPFNTSNRNPVSISHHGRFESIITIKL